MALQVTTPQNAMTRVTEDKHLTIFPRLQADTLSITFEKEIVTGPPENPISTTYSTTCVARHPFKTDVKTQVDDLDNSELSSAMEQMTYVYDDTDYISGHYVPFSGSEGGLIQLQDFATSAGGDAQELTTDEQLYLLDGKLTSAEPEMGIYFAYDFPTVSKTYYLHGIQFSSQYYEDLGDALFKQYLLYAFLLKDNTVSPTMAEYRSVMTTFIPPDAVEISGTYTLAARTISIPWSLYIAVSNINSTTWASKLDGDRPGIKMMHDPSVITNPQERSFKKIDYLSRPIGFKDPFDWDGEYIYEPVSGTVPEVQRSKHNWRDVLGGNG